MANENYTGDNMILSSNEQGTVLDSGKVLRIIETDDINKINFLSGQYIIVNNDDSGNVYFDPTTGASIEDRIHLNPKQEIDVYTIENNRSIQYYLDLQTKPKDGDLCIIKEPIEGSDKFINHVFVYNNNEEDTNEADWCELIDSHKSSEIYIDKDFIVTNKISDDIELIDGRQTLNTKGKTINELFDLILSPEKYPKIELPSLNINILNKGKHLIDSIVSTDFVITFTKGKYEFGPSTGITLNRSNITIIDSNGSTCSNYTIEEDDDKYTLTGSFGGITVSDDTNYRIRATVLYSNGAIPKTARNEDYLDGRISSSTLSVWSDAEDEENIIVGYNEGLYYGTSESVLDPQSVTFEYLKTLNSTGLNYSENNVELTVPVGTSSIIIACPQDTDGFNKIYNVTANCYMNEAFGDAYTLSYVVNDNTHYYNYWIYTPADPYINKTILIISIG